MKLRIHTCKAESCQRVISVRMLMCIDHWRMVPKATRDEVLASWKQRRLLGGPAEIERHTAAVDAAVAAVKEKQERKAAAKAGPSGELFI